MSIVALPAHYDGERICLDEEYDLKPYSKLIVTILPEEEPVPIPLETFYARIEESEKALERGEITTQDDLRKEIGTWKKR